MALSYTALLKAPVLTWRPCASLHVRVDVLWPQSRTHWRQGCPGNCWWSGEIELNAVMRTCSKQDWDQVQSGQRVRSCLQARVVGLVLTFRKLHHVFQANLGYPRSWRGRKRQIQSLQPWGIGGVPYCGMQGHMAVIPSLSRMRQESASSRSNRATQVRFRLAYASE